jgi:hypothetical protein
MNAAPAPLIERLVPAGGFTVSHAAEDDETLRQRLERDGYLFMSALLPQARLEAVRREILALCREHGWIADGTEPLDGIYSGRPFPDYQREYMPLYRRLLEIPSFNELSRASETITLFERVFAGPVLPHPKTIARIAFPRHYEFTTQPHQDFHYIRGAPATYTAWIPLGDCPPELGGLAVLEGSHHRGFMPHERTTGAGQHGVRTGETGLRWLSSGYRSGDLLLFHSYTVHAALPNDTADRLRLSVDYRYQRPGEEIHPRSLLPHTG